jgi:hypothetical protein
LFSEHGGNNGRSGAKTMAETNNGDGERQDFDVGAFVVSCCPSVYLSVICGTLFLSLALHLLVATSAGLGLVV